MRGKWKTTYKQEGASIMYGVCRLIDVKATDNPGNREYAREWYHKCEDAQHEADVLNSIDSKRMKALKINMP